MHAIDVQRQRLAQRLARRPRAPAERAALTERAVGLDHRVQGLGLGRVDLASEQVGLAPDAHLAADLPRAPDREPQSGSADEARETPAPARPAGSGDGAGRAGAGPGRAAGQGRGSRRDGNRRGIGPHGRRERRQDVDGLRLRPPRLTAGVAAAVRNRRVARDWPGTSGRHQRRYTGDRRQRTGAGDRAGRRVADAGVGAPRRVHVERQNARDVRADWRGATGRLAPAAQRVACLAGGREPRRRVARQQSMDERDEVARAIVGQRRRPAVDLAEHVALAAVEGRRAGEQLAEHDAERPAVAHRADVAVDQPLGRHVGRAAEDVARLAGSAADALGDAEVEHADPRRERRRVVRASVRGRRRRGCCAA